MLKNISSITQVKQYAIEAGKKTLYLVLKKKPLSVETIEKLNDNFQKKFEEYIIRIIPALQKLNPEDPEKVLKYIALNAMLQILTKIMNDSYLNLSENDRILAEEIYNNGKNFEKTKDDNQSNENYFGTDSSD